MIRFRAEVKFWPPSVEEARPSRCSLCGVAAYDGLRVVLHGHGLSGRGQRGPREPGGEPVCEEFLARRYRCTACTTVLRVLLASGVARKHFSGAAIALALTLWGLCGNSARQVRELVSDQKKLGACARGWLSLERWAREVAAGRLFAGLGLKGFAGTPREVAARAAQALIGWAPLAAQESAPEAAAFTGASYVS